MRISKSLPLMVATVLCATISVRADDNAAQAAARAALLQKMQELDSGDSNSAPPPAVPAPAPENQPPPAETPSAPEMAAPQPETKPPMAPENAAPVEAPSAPTATSQMPPVENSPETAPAESAPMATAPAQTLQQIETNRAAALDAAQAEEQAIISRHATQTQPPAIANSPVPNEAVSPSPMPATRKRGFFSHILHPFGQSSRSAVTEQRQMQPIAPAYSGKNNSGFTPITPPSPPVSPEQDAQLQALLEKYKADQITPEQYQSERAAIVGPR